MADPNSSSSSQSSPESSKPTLQFKALHNTHFSLSLESDPEYIPIISFLRKSNFFTAITINPTLYEEHILQFWQNCQVVKRPDQKLLTSKIHNLTVTISPATIRKHLKLGDEEGKLSFPRSEVNATFREMGYEGKLPTSTFKKGLVSFNWKFLFHIFLHCLSNKSGGWDQIPSDLASAIHGLVKNQTYNFSNYIFNNMVDNLSSPTKFLMYPRFIQHLLNCELGDKLTGSGNIRVDTGIKNKVLTQLKKPGVGFSGKIINLFSHMLEVTEPQGEHLETPTNVDPTPSSVTAKTVQYSRKRKSVHLSKDVQIPSSVPKKARLEARVPVKAKAKTMPKKKSTKAKVPLTLPVQTLTQTESPHSESQHSGENIQRDSHIIGEPSQEGTSLGSGPHPGSIEIAPSMPYPKFSEPQDTEQSLPHGDEALSPTSLTIRDVLTQMKQTASEPSPDSQEVDPRVERVNVEGAATTAETSIVQQASGNILRTPTTATQYEDASLEASLVQGKPGRQETTSGGGEGEARPEAPPSPKDSTRVDEGSLKHQINELTDLCTTLGARVVELESQVSSLPQLTALCNLLAAKVANLESEVSTLKERNEFQEALILSLSGKPTSSPNPATQEPLAAFSSSTPSGSPSTRDATKKGEELAKEAGGSSSDRKIDELGAQLLRNVTAEVHFTPIFQHYTTVTSAEEELYAFLDELDAAEEPRFKASEDISIEEFSDILSSSEVKMLKDEPIVEQGPSSTSSSGSSSSEDSEDGMDLVGAEAASFKPSSEEAFMAPSADAPESSSQAITVYNRMVERLPNLDPEFQLLRNSARAEIVAWGYDEETLRIWVGRYFTLPEEFNWVNLDMLDICCISELRFINPTNSMPGWIESRFIRQRVIDDILSQEMAMDSQLEQIERMNRRGVNVFEMERNEENDEDLAGIVWWSPDGSHLSAEQRMMQNWVINYSKEERQLYRDILDVVVAASRSISIGADTLIFNALTEVLSRRAAENISEPSTARVTMILSDDEDSEEPTVEAPSVVKVIVGQPEVTGDAKIDFEAEAFTKGPAFTEITMPPSADEPKPIGEAATSEAQVSIEVPITSRAPVVTESVPRRPRITIIHPSMPSPSTTDKKKDKGKKKIVEEDEEDKKKRKKKEYEDLVRFERERQRKEREERKKLQAEQDAIALARDPSYARVIQARPLSPESRKEKEIELETERLKRIAQLEEFGYVMEDLTGWTLENLNLELVRARIKQMEHDAKVLRQKEREEQNRRNRDARLEADKENMKSYLRYYNYTPQQLGPMKASSMALKISDIKRRIAAGELPPLAQKIAEWKKIHAALPAKKSKKSFLPPAPVRDYGAEPPTPSQSSSSSSSSDKKPISSIVKVPKVVSKPKAKILDPTAEEEMVNSSKVKSWGYKPELKKFVITRKSNVQSFLDAEEVVDLPSMVIDELIRMKKIFGCRNDEEVKMVDTLIKHIHPSTGRGLPNHALGGYDPISSWEYDAERNLYYLTRSAAGRVAFERNQLMCLSRFDFADIATVRLQNPTNDVEAQMVERVMLRTYKEDIDNLNAVAEVRRAEEESRKKRRRKSQAKRQLKRLKSTLGTPAEQAESALASAPETSTPTEGGSSSIPPRDPEDVTLNPKGETMADVEVRIHMRTTYQEEDTSEEKEASEGSGLLFSSESEGSPSTIRDWNYDDQTSRFFIIRRNKERTWFVSEVEVLQLSAEDLERMYELINENRPVSNYYRYLALMLQRIHNNASQLVVQEVIDVQPLDQHDPIISWSYDHHTGLYRIERTMAAPQELMETQLFGLRRRDIQDLASLPLNNPTKSRLGVLTEATIKILAHQR